MQYRQLGKWGIRVSEVALGGWLTHGRSLDDEATRAVVSRAFDLGINFFDTADVYNRGKGESALGCALKDLRREDLVIGTKCFFPMSDGPNDRGLGRKHIFESVHASLQRLGTNYIDLMQFHRFDPETPYEETVRAIDDLIRQGKVLYWGTSEWQAHQIAEVVAVAKELNANPPISNQPRYNMLARGIEEAVIPVSEKNGIGQVVFSPLAQGLLTGKYVPGQDAPSGSRGADDKSNMFMRDQLADQDELDRIQTLKSFVEEQGFRLPQFALAWCLRLKGISSVIMGATSVDQVEANASASGLDIAPEIFVRAEEILAGV